MNGDSIPEGKLSMGCREGLRSYVGVERGT
jgi:hypothetical protein